MARYSLEVKRSAAREIEALPTRKIRRSIVDRIARLASEPRAGGAEKLAGSERHRVRRGPYRIVYEIDEDASAVLVVKVGHHRDVYRR